MKNWFTKPLLQAAAPAQWEDETLWPRIAWRWWFFRWEMGKIDSWKHRSRNGKHILGVHLRIQLSGAFLDIPTRIFTTWCQLQTVTKFRTGVPPVALGAVLGTAAGAVAAGPVIPGAAGPVAPCVASVAAAGVAAAGVAGAGVAVAGVAIAGVAVAPVAGVAAAGVAIGGVAVASGEVANVAVAGVAVAAGIAAGVASGLAASAAGAVAAGEVAAAGAGFSSPLIWGAAVGVSSAICARRDNKV